MKLDLKAFKNRVLVENLEFGMKTTDSGFILQDDDGTLEGIRSRWALVYKVGPDVKDIKVGDYVLLDHGRWTRGFVVDTNEGKKKLHMIDYPDGAFLKTNQLPKELKQTQLT